MEDTNDTPDVTEFEKETLVRWWPTTEAMWLALEQFIYGRTFKTPSGQAFLIDIEAQEDFLWLHDDIIPEDVFGEDATLEYRHVFHELRRLYRDDVNSVLVFWNHPAVSRIVIGDKAN